MVWLNTIISNNVTSHIYNISAKYLSNILSNNDFMPKKEVKIVRSATLFSDFF
jgi:hypothetical protein